MPARADEFALSYCGRCDEVTKHRVTSIIETHPRNFGRTANARCPCGMRAVVGLPPTPEDMERLRRKWAGQEPDDIPME